MTFASFSTVIAVFENLVAFLTDTFGMSRTKASIINGIIMFFACLPCIFGFNIWSDFNILGKGVLDLEDFVVSNLLLPIAQWFISCSAQQNSVGALTITLKNVTRVKVLNFQEC